MASIWYHQRKRTRKARVVMYTAVSGGYDAIFPHIFLVEDWDYVCFTDQPDMVKGVWECRKLEHRFGIDHNRNAKYYKMFPQKLFPEYDYSIWIDANCDVLGEDLSIAAYAAMDERMALSAPLHEHRKCVYKEITKLIALKKDSYAKIKEWESILESSHYPHDNGLYALGIIFRRHNDPTVAALMEEWWQIIQRYSKRDQISFVYLLRKYGIACPPLLGDKGIGNHPGLLLRGHRSCSKSLPDV